MKEALKRKMEHMKGLKGKSMHENADDLSEGSEHMGMGRDHNEEHMHEKITKHDQSGSDLAPPIGHGEADDADMQDELIGEHEMRDGLTHKGALSHETSEDAKDEAHEMEILKALGGRGGVHLGRKANGLREHVADNAKEKFASIMKNKKRY